MPAIALPRKHAAGHAHRSLRGAGEKTAACPLRMVARKRLLRRSGAPYPRDRTRAPGAAEEAAKQPAAGGLLCLLFQFLDAGLCRVQGLLLHDDRLRHVVWRAGLPGNLVIDEAFRFGITRRRLPLDIGELFEQIPERLLVVPVHETQLRLSRRVAPERFSRRALSLLYCTSLLQYRCRDMH